MTTSPIRCPRCDRDSPVPTAFCPGCGAPLLLGDEAAPGSRLHLREEAAPALDAMVDIDRRAAQVALVDPSDWDLGRADLPIQPAPVAAVAAPVAGDDAVPDPEVEVLEIHVERPPGWRRAAAWGVDSVPFALGGGILLRSLLREASAGMPAPPGLDGLLDLLARERLIAVSVAAAAALALAVYGTLAHALAGATLGKRLLGLRVIGPDGGPPSPARSAARTAVSAVSAALVGLGFLLALFTRSGRALHDLIARTWVVKAP